MHSGIYGLYVAWVPQRGSTFRTYSCPSPTKLRSGCPAARASLGWKRCAVGLSTRCLGPVYMQPKNLCCNFFVVWRSRGRWFCSNTKFLKCLFDQAHHVLKIGVTVHSHLVIACAVVSCCGNINSQSLGVI